jgi:DNA-binding MarR family transcriptional regulator
VLLQSIAVTREISQLQLSEKLSAASATLSRRLSCLRKKGLVDLHLGARGSRIYTLTPAGRALLNSTSLQWESAQHRLRAALGDDNWQVFSLLCDRVCEAAKEAETMRVAFCSRQAAD